ncbi:MAG: hypothetical protein HY867_14910 [Chloroflexi bacterium]|nr:hypothetical protein [Chloroflexota bacterium]
MTIHSIPQIGGVLRNAVVFNFRNSREKMLRAELIPAQTERFFDLLEKRKVEYALVNGIALLTYVEGRNTQDIDLIMALPSLSKLPEIKIESEDMYFARGKFGELQIDILLTKNPLFAKVEKKYTATKKFMDRKIRCATVEGLILLKLFALPSLYRQGSFERVGIYENDTATLMNAFNPKMEPLLKELGKHLNETDLKSARSIVAEIESRIQRFRKAGK